ncbi:MAG TPA: hypothetical protein VNO30_19475 [Kofleriaceae bacterium]|nr:hypothetical protein [Kofleriaceae bacterium]
MATPAPYLGLHLDHRFAPIEDEHLTGTLVEILARPCFAALTRVAAQFRDRDPSYQPKHPASIASALRSPAAIAIVLDCGRRDDPTATARICTARPPRTPHTAAARPFLASVVVVPARRADAPAILDAFVDLAAALQAVAGYIAVEPDHDRAHRAALAQAPSREDVRDHYRRAQERRAHAWYDRAIDAQLAGPEWGIVLGPRHLGRLAPDPACFPVIREAGAAKLALLSTSPADALEPHFERRLDAARQALAPLLMDVSTVPVL